MLHTFVALVEDTPGALTRVASLFRRLNINIISLTVGHSERNGVSRMTIVCEAPPGAGHRIKASMFKIENVLDVDDVGQLSCVVRELALIKVAATPKTRAPIFQLAEVFRARVVDLAPESLMLEITGVASKIEGLIQVLNEGDNKILEISRHRTHGDAPRPPHLSGAGSHGNRQARGGADHSRDRRDQDQQQPGAGLRRPEPSAVVNGARHLPQLADVGRRR